jgi:succinylglutamic semialdehyde dehydrogenase
MSLFIDGAWRGGRGEHFTSINPANGKTIWEGSAATSADVIDATLAARKAFVDWSLTSLEQRTEIVRRYAGLLGDKKAELSQLIADEAGKVLWDAAGEAGAMTNKIEISLKAYDERTGSRDAVNGAIRSRLGHRPHGVMAVFGPYNFPGHLPNGHIVPALIAGNTVVFKPSELTPAVAEYMVKTWQEAGLPAGVLNLVQGARATGEALVESPEIDGLLFTGSAKTGHILARQLLDRPHVIQALELGGNNPLIVHEAKNHEAAAVLTVLSAFISSGQRCTCARRLIVPEGEAGDQFVAALCSLIDRIQVGDAASEDPVFMGPVINGAAASTVLAAQEALEASGGMVLRRVERLSKGEAFLSPGLIDVTKATDRPDEEVFGPMLQLIRVPSFDDAVQEANNTKYGLASGLISDNRDRYDYFYPRSRAGIVNWNQQLTGAASTAPFGGIGWSGNHRPSAYYAADYCSYAVATMEQAEGKVEVAALPQGIADEGDAE